MYEYLVDLNKTFDRQVQETDKNNTNSKRIKNSKFFIPTVKKRTRYRVYIKRNHKND